MSDLHVVFRVGDSEYVLAASDVLQMESYNGAVKVPGTAPYVAGLLQVRGRVVPIVDLRARFGLEPVERTLDTRVVVVQSGERTVGLLVDSAREVLRLSGEQLRPPPEVLAHQGQGFVKSVAQAGERLVMLIDFHKVIGEAPNGHSLEKAKAEPAAPAAPAASMIERA
ncbi:MAG TPA: chemotaxis protein CheW [Polyangia bacterium]|jgi:purine-binding chemotaxis protein CheW|nr:chemotaxis protein CheW [Polyangia bacterium]